MKSLIKNYMELLTIDKVKEFGIKNNIYLNNEELQYLFKLVKENYEDMLVNEEKYLNDLKNNINENDFYKIKELFTYYKNRYKGYLF